MIMQVNMYNYQFLYKCQTHLQVSVILIHYNVYLFAAWIHSRLTRSRSFYKLCMLCTSHFVCNGFTTDNFMSTLTTSPSSNCIATSSAYKSSKQHFINCLNAALTLKSSGWSLSVQLAGTYTICMLCFCNRSQTSSAWCALKISKTHNARCFSGGYMPAWQRLIMLSLHKIA